MIKKEKVLELLNFLNGHEKEMDKFVCWFCNYVRKSDFPIDENGYKYCSNCNSNQ